MVNRRIRKEEQSDRDQAYPPPPPPPSPTAETPCPSNLYTKNLSSYHGNGRIPTFSRLREKTPAHGTKEQQPYLEMKKSVATSRGPPYGVGTADNPFGITGWKSEKTGSPSSSADSSSHEKGGNGRVRQLEEVDSGGIRSEKEQKPFIFNTPIGPVTCKTKPLNNVHLPPSMLYPPKFAKDPLAEYNRTPRMACEVINHGSGGRPKFMMGTPFDNKSQGATRMKKKYVRCGTEEWTKDVESTWGNSRNEDKMPEIGELIRIAESVNGFYKQIDDLSSSIDTIIARLRTA